MKTIKKLTKDGECSVAKLVILKPRQKLLLENNYLYRTLPSFALLWNLLRKGHGVVGDLRNSV